MAKTRVLVVEDAHDIASLIKHTLERAGGTDVETVVSGDAALRSVTEHLPDLVILDINIPVLSGWKCAASCARDRIRRRCRSSC